MTTPVVLEIDHGVATLTIAREERRNSLDHVAMRRLEEALVECAAGAAGVLIVTGAGGRAFCAGDDVKAYAERTQEESRAHHERGLRTFDALERFPGLTIARSTAIASEADWSLRCAAICASPGPARRSDCRRSRSSTPCRAGAASPGCLASSASAAQCRWRSSASASTPPRHCGSAWCTGGRSGGGARERAGVRGRLRRQGAPRHRRRGQADPERFDRHSLDRRDPGQPLAERSNAFEGA